MGPLRAKELEEELGEIIENLQILGYKEVKPWAEFLSAMKPPAQWDAKHLEQRVTTNFLYYRSNYLLICAAIIIFRIILSPLTLFSIILTVAVVGYITVMVKTPLIMGETVIDQQKKNWACVALSVIILGLSGTIAEMFWSIFIAVAVCLAHMLFRARSISSKMNKVQEEVKLNSGHSSHIHGGSSGGASAGVGVNKTKVAGSSHTSKIVENVNSLISEVFQSSSSSTSKAKKQDLSAPNDISSSSSNNNSIISAGGDDEDDIESRPATARNDTNNNTNSHHNINIGNNSPYQVKMSVTANTPGSSASGVSANSGSAIKRSSPITHHGSVRAPGKSD